jgi:aldose 1-epimerase
VEENRVVFAIDSPDGHEGYPSDLYVEAVYDWDDDNRLELTLLAQTNGATVINLTNHAYFNLAGAGNGNIKDHSLRLNATKYLPTDQTLVPTGAFDDVEGTPMDFRTPCPIGQRINEDYESLKLQAGYDHNWEVFCNPCAILSDPVSGRTLAISTDCPGIQVYAGNYLNLQGKDGVYYSRRSGVALETQFYPDSVNHPEWKQPFVKAGTPYKSETIYTFSW